VGRPAAGQACASKKAACRVCSIAGVKFVYVVSGRLHYRYGAETIDLQTGDSLLCEAGIEYGAEVAGDAAASFLPVGFQLSA
jgi:uncharacterized cupin superfamily protein